VATDPVTDDFQANAIAGMRRLQRLRRASHSEMSVVIFEMFLG